MDKDSVNIKIEENELPVKYRNYKYLELGKISF